jgi:hypothetical protein
MRRAAALALLVVSCASPAQDGHVARPDVKPGDRWVYRHVDPETGAPRGRPQYTAVFASDKAIQVVVDRPSKSNDVDETYTADWNAVSTVDGSNYDPHLGLLRFPLAVGDAWPVAYENTVPKRGAYRVKVGGKSRVAGWEDVRVPAGRFHALKIVFDGEFQRIDRSAAGITHVEIWYAPRVKRWVRWTYEEKGRRGLIRSGIFELTEFEVK